MAEGVEGAEHRWLEVDRHLEAVLVPDDPVLAEALHAARGAGLPSIEVSPLQGRLLTLLGRAAGCQRILEIGTLGGYSTIFLARALPAGGRLISLELEPEHAAVARANLQRAGLAERAEVRVGPAVESMRSMVAGGEDPFDMVFIDADKPSTVDYLELALRLSHQGTLIVVDNIVRRGAIVAAQPDDNAAAMRRAIEVLGADPRLEATVIQTVGSKGHDGFALAQVL